MADVIPGTLSIPSDGDDVVLLLTQSNIQIVNWVEYSYNEHFLTPSDAFSFTIAEERVDAETAAALVPGAAVTLTINGFVQSSGYIDAVEKRASRGSGVEWHIHGRDKLGQAVDAGIDPTTQFKAKQTLVDLLLAVYAPFGWTTPDAFVVDNDENRGTLTGQKRGKRTSKKGKVLKQFEIHQLRPYAKEGAHEFAARVCQRQGLWIWPSADGQKLIVSTPDFEQDPIYTIRRTYNADNNVLDGTVTYDVSNQPSIIAAEGFGGGGEYGHGRVRASMANPVTQVTLTPAADAIARTVFSKYTPVLPTKHAPSYSPVLVPSMRVMYLHDDESKTQDELNNFVYREMALRVRQSLSVHYTVEGHGQGFDDGTFCPWGVDLVVDVHDEVGGVFEPMWVLSRTFKKSRNGGTTTDLELLRLYSLDF